MVGTNGVGRRLVDPEKVSIEELTGEDVYTTERGFKLKILPVPWDLVVEARNRVPMPEAPLLQVYDEHGKAVPGKFDQNFMDPTYQKKMDEWNNIIKKLTWQVMFAYGISAYGIPPSFATPDSEDWIAELQDADIFSVGAETYAVEVAPASQPRRRLADYFRLYVLTKKDADVLNEALLHGLGKVLETDVEEAVESFPGDEGGLPNSGSDPASKRAKA